MDKFKLWAKFICILVVSIFMLFSIGHANAATKYIVFGGGGTGGTFFLVASGMATLAEKYIPGVSATSETSGGSIENCKRLARGQQTFATVSAETGFHAYRKLREFSNSQDKLEDLRLVMYGYLTTLQMLTLEDSGIKSVADFKGKKISLAIGPVAKAWWPFIRDAYSLKDSDYSNVVLRPAEQMNALRDGNVDAVVYWGAAPAVAITDLATTKKVRFIEIGDKEAEMILKDRPYFSKGKLAANMYRGQESDINTLQTSITITTTASVDSDLVYKLLDVILSHNDELKQVHPKAAEFNKENAIALEVYPYHEGAIKYYKEHNMMK